MDFFDHFSNQENDSLLNISFWYCGEKLRQGERFQTDLLVRCSSDYDTSLGVSPFRKLHLVD